MAFIDPPHRIPLWLRPFLWLAERVAGRTLLPARVLAWYPRAAIGSGVLEALVAHAEGRADARILALVRLGASYTIGCAFCVDMNSAGEGARELSPTELTALREGRDPGEVPSFSEAERAALRYARAVSRSPLVFDPELVDALRAHFDERELVVLATTAAQVNYWGRLIQGLGIPPAGFCSLPGDPVNGREAG